MIDQVWHPFKEGDDREALAKIAQDNGTMGVTTDPPGVYLPRNRVRDPSVRRHIARQQAGCKGCGDTPLAGI